MNDEWGESRPAVAPRDQGSMMTTLLTEQEAAGLLRMSVKSLQGWRVKGGGPKFLKIGRCVRYAIPDLEAFLQEAVRPQPVIPA